MHIGFRCQGKSKVHNKENQRNNSQFSSVNLTNKDISFSRVFKELQLSTDHIHTSINSSEFSGFSGKEEELLLQSLDLNESRQKEMNDSETYMSIYGDSIRKESLREPSLGSFLSRHKIDVGLRARMLDWMTEVTCSYKFQPKTYFDGIQYLDKYLQAKRQPVEPTELHPLGVVCMLIASKSDQVFPLRIGMVYEKIGHRKISMNKLVSVQGDIMGTLNFQINEWTFFDIASLSISALNDSLMLKVLAYICRFVVIEYEFYGRTSPALIGQACAWVVMQIFHQKEPIWMNNRFEVLDCGRKVLSLIRGFKSVHPNIRNADRFTESSVIEKVTSYVELQ